MKFYVIEPINQNAPKLIVPENKRLKGSIELGAFLKKLKQ